MELREGLLVDFFLAGLVSVGSLQAYWLKPLIQSLNGNAMFFGATGLTALTDNAALTYLGSLVQGISDELEYALVAGTVTGGGLTVMANAPKPAGVGILQTAKVFQREVISPLGLFPGALLPTAVASCISGFCAEWGRGESPRLLNWWQEGRHWLPGRRRPQPRGR